MSDLGSSQAPKAYHTGPHKRVQWRRPTAGKRRPGVVDATRAELVRGLEQRMGPIWFRIHRHAVIAGYAIERFAKEGRVRALRKDAAESLLAMTVALLYLADVRTGFVGRPPKTGTGHRWDRYTLADLAQMAFGAQTPAELRRARRALDVMISVGWAFPTKQVRRYKDDGTIRSEAGVRRLNLTRLCAMAGTSWLLSRDRQHADRVRGNGTASMEEARQRRQTGQEPRQGREAAIAGRSSPPATGDPPPRLGAVHEIAAIAELFAKG